MSARSQAINVFARQLELCRVRSGDSVALLCDTDSNQTLLQCATEALAQLGIVSDTVLVDLSLQRLHTVSDEMPVDADFVLDFSSCLPQQIERLVTSGSRVLKVLVQNIGDLQEVAPHSGLGRRAKRGLELLNTSRQLCLTDDTGTKLTVDLNDTQCWQEDGLSTVAGQLVRWPRGVIGVPLESGTAKGKVVLAPGDVWLPMGWFVRCTVTLKINKGRLVAVNGPQGEVEAIESYLNSCGDADVYRLSTLEIGLLWLDQPAMPQLFERGLADSLFLCDLYGHVSIFTGAQVDDRRHMRGIGGCLRTATVALDDVCVIRSGCPQGELAPDVYEQAAHRWPLYHG